MRAPDHPSDLSPDQRHRELAHILAAGVLRLRQRRLLAVEPSTPQVETASKSAAGGLDVAGETVLSVHTG